MNNSERACIVGAYEHPTRHAPDKSVAQLHAEVARGALHDAGLQAGDIDVCGEKGGSKRVDSINTDDIIKPGGAPFLIPLPRERKKRNL